MPTKAAAGAIVGSRAEIGEDCVIGPFAVIEDAAKVGRATKVWHFAHVRSGAVIGDACILGKGAYVDTGAVVGNGCKLQNNVNVYNGVQLGNGVFVGPNASFTNDLRPRAALWGKERLGLTIVDDGASIGANSVIVCGKPGETRRLGAHCMVGAGSVVSCNIPPHALVKGNPASLAGWVCKCGRKLAGRDAKAGTVLPCSCGESFTVVK